MIKEDPKVEPFGTDVERLYHRKVGDMIKS